MLCLFPRTIKNPKFGKSTFDPNEKYFEVPCGKCYACTVNKSRDWFLRIYFEAKRFIHSYFVTLTYNEANCDGNVHKEDVQKWLKRLRKQSGVELKYFIISEYGPKTQRPHYHAILLCNKSLSHDLIAKTWQKGFVTISPMSNRRILYCTRYMSRAPRDQNIVNKNFMLSSRRPALGLKYFEEHLSDFLSEKFFATLQIEGSSYRIPRYYLSKLEEHVRKNYRDAYKQFENQFQKLLDQESYADLAVLQAEDKRKLANYRKKSKV